MAWGQATPLAAAPPWRLDLLGPAPPQGPYLKRGEGGQPHPSPWSLPLPMYHLSLSLSLAKPCRDRRYFHHHAVVLLDLHQPLLPPCWIKKEETSSPTVRVLNAEVPSVRRSVIDDLDHDEYDSINPVQLNASPRDLQGYVDALLSLVAR